MINASTNHVREP